MVLLLQLFSVLQLRKLKHQEVKLLAQSHTESMWWSQNWDSSLSDRLWDQALNYYNILLSCDTINLVQTKDTMWLWLWQRPNCCKSVKISKEEESRSRKLQKKNVSGDRYSVLECYRVGIREQWVRGVLRFLHCYSQTPGRWVKDAKNKCHHYSNV